MLGRVYCCCSAVCILFGWLCVLLLMAFCNFFYLCIIVVVWLCVIVVRWRCVIIVGLPCVLLLVLVRIVKFGSVYSCWTVYNYCWLACIIFVGWSCVLFLVRRV